jgi:hypothetical protein
MLCSECVACRNIITGDTVSEPPARYTMEGSEGTRVKMAGTAVHGRARDSTYQGNAQD